MPCFDQATLCVLFVVLLAYLFDFINGFHDAANSIATIVTTGVLTPRQAVLWAAFFNFIAFIFFNLMVAKTIGQHLIDPTLVDATLIFAALIGAIAWGLLTWFFGLPSSSSHALIGGLAGAALVRGGIATLQWYGFFKVAVGIFIVPLLGLLFGLGLTRLLSRLPNHQDKLFKLLQLISSAILSLAHGGNDAQKTMGIIAVLLFSSSWLHGSFYIPFWVVITCQLMISLGTFFGGWRIVNTMGTKIAKLDTLRGCASESGAALVIFIATFFGVPISTTQTLTGAIAGTGLEGRGSGTDWGMIRLIFLSWLLTIPGSGLVAAMLMLVL